MKNSFRRILTGIVLHDIFICARSGCYDGTVFFRNIGAYDAVMRLDHKIKHFVISPLSKELTDDATRRVKSALNGLRRYKAKESYFVLLIYHFIDD